ncbi:MAG: hypothetical protein OXH78_03310 [Acidimicrobiaceae bacterium]|nr:hypothetical protein [Acidimicrobiaceae bacterium]
MPMRQQRFMFAVLGAVIRRPSLWATAMLEARRFVPDDWLRRRPFLPLPAPEMLRFRLSTQYGDPESRVVASDVVVWLRWCKAENRRERRD